MKIINVDQKGLSLIETAILLIVAGLLVLPMLRLLEIQEKQKTLDQSQDRGSVIAVALQKYAVRNGAYPVPAARNLSLQDPNLGRAVDPAGAGNCSDPLGTPDVCRVPGARNFEGGPLETVLIGDVPFADIGLPIEYILDGYGRKFTYVVSENLTDVAGTFNEKGGVIQIVDAAGDDPGDAGDGGMGVQFLLLSHGPDGRGAYSLGGALYAPCQGQGADITNCDFTDAVFNNNYDVLVEEDIDGNGTIDLITYGRKQNLVAGVQYYDDFMQYETRSSKEIWSEAVGDEAIFSDLKDGEVILVGDTSYDSGDEALLTVVEGHVVVEGRVIVDRLCKKDGEADGRCEDAGAAAGTADPSQGYPEKVFDPSIIGGSIDQNYVGDGGGINCGKTTGRLMSGISESDELCSLGAPKNLGGSGTCANSWELAYGFDASGNILCKEPGT